MSAILVTTDFKIHLGIPIDYLPLFLLAVNVACNFKLTNCYATVKY